MKRIPIVSAPPIRRKAGEREKRKRVGDDGKGERGNARPLP